MLQPRLAAASGPLLPCGGGLGWGGRTGCCPNPPPQPSPARGEGARRIEGAVMLRPRLARMAPCLVLSVWCAATLLVSPHIGHAQPAPQGEVKAVVRISKRLIDDVVASKDVNG